MGMSLCLAGSALGLVMAARSSQHFASLHQRSQFRPRDLERHMAETAFAGQDQPFARKMVQRWFDAPADYVGGFNAVAALVNHAERQVAFEFPLAPKLHQVVAQRA